MIRCVALCLAFAASAAVAQEGEILIVPPEEDGNLIVPERLPDGSLLEPDLDLNFIPADPEVPEEPQIVAVTAGGAVVRALDRMSGAVVDMQLSNGESTGFGRLQITLGECRYPEDNPSGDAFAYLVIRTEGEEVPIFEGWMIASSPALNAMDHPRYDVWVLNCRTSASDGGEG